MLADSVIETEPGLGAVANLDRATRLAHGLLNGEHSGSGGADGAHANDGRKGAGRAERKGGGPASSDAHHATSHGPLVAVGACTFGIPFATGVALSPAIRGWDELPLLASLEEAFGVPVTLVTDVKAAAAAEMCRGALVGANPALYLNLGTGLAVAIVHDGKVMTGAHGASGEIGYNLRSAADLGLAADHEGRAVLLEDVVSGMGIARSVARLNGKAASPAAPASPASAAGLGGAADVFDRALADPIYEKVLEEFLRELCYHLVNLTIAVDPERIAVGGGMVRSWEVLEPALRVALDAHVPYPPELVVGTFPYDAALRGALDSGLELARRSTGQPGSTGQDSPDRRERQP